MHIIMGLGNTVFNELKKVVIELDGEVERNVEQSERLKDLYKKKEELDIIFSNYNLDKMILINDSERVEAFLEGDKKKAEKVALANYEPFHSKKKKKNCDAEMCILFPVDEKNGYAEIIKCVNSCVLHVRCEGLILMDGEEFPDDYQCKKCEFEESNKHWLKATVQNGILKFTDEIQKLSVELTKLKMAIEFAEDDISGEREKKLKESCKNLNLNPACYHGGDFEGKAIQKMLDCARNQKYELLDCIEDKLDLYGKFQRALSTLQEASDCLRRGWDDFEDSEVEIVRKICERWGQNWKKDFPHLNITPKGHDLVFALPEFLKRTRSFHMFYKFEEQGESIHRELNAIERRIWAIRNPEEQLWAYIQRYELKNQLDTTIVQPGKRKR